MKQRDDIDCHSISEADAKALESVFRQNGGCRPIDYDGLQIFAPMSDIKFAIKHLEKKNTKNRSNFLIKVKHSIDMALPRVKSGEASQKEAMDCGQDIAIWFAGEVLAGRAKLEETKQ